VINNYLLRGINNKLIVLLYCSDDNYDLIIRAGIY